MRVLSECIEFARVPDSFFAAKAKEVFGAISKATSEKAVELLAAYLRNPMM